MVVFSGEPQRTRFDAHVDVFRDQHHFARCVPDAQCFDHAQNLVVCLALRQAGGEGEVQRLGLKEQAATYIHVACAIELDARDDVCIVRGHQRIE